MPRLIEDNWPTYEDSLGDPGSGTAVDAQLLDEILDALVDSFYSQTQTDGIPGIINEVVEGRGGEASLDARFDAIEDDIAAIQASSADTTVAAGWTISGPSGSMVAPFFRVPFSCTVLAIYGYRKGDSALNTIQVVRRRGGSEVDLISADMTMSISDAYIDATSAAGGSNTLQNISLQEGDILRLEVANGGGADPDAYAVSVVLSSS